VQSYDIKALKTNAAIRCRLFGPKCGVSAFFAAFLRRIGLKNCGENFVVNAIMPTFAPLKYIFNQIKRNEECT